MEDHEMLERYENGEDPLELSIEKWEDIVNGSGQDHGGENCALCQKYFDVSDDEHKNCAGCPILEKTGYRGCVGTPYEEYSNLSNWEDEEEYLRLANEELDFLKSLRTEPEEELHPIHEAWEKLREAAILVRKTPCLELECDDCPIGTTLCEICGFIRSGTFDPQD